MIGKGNIKMALEAIRTSRWRSLLTMLGIIIGVVSVITTVSLGEGIKQRIVGQINQAGSDLITIRPGKQAANGGLGAVSNLAFGSLSQADLSTIKAVPGVRLAVPFAYVTGLARSDTREYGSGPIIATNQGAADALNQKMEYGTFFSDNEAEMNAAVIGKRVAEQLFQENVPLGKSFTIRDQTFVVVGIFNEFNSSPLALNADYNYAIFIPYGSAERIGADQPQMYQILAKPSASKQTAGVAKVIKSALLSAHGGQADFTVLDQKQNLAAASGVLNLLTNFIAGIAAISLVVGGIGIMNVMLVSVTERTREIGVRKAIGATNQQILGQFLIESVIVSLTGGIVGIFLALLANYGLRIFTSLTPVITLPIVVLAVGVAVMVGVIFGITPALRAARKDPIEALRYE